MVYGHTGVDFPYYDAYTRLRYHENPFMGPFAKDYFSNFGKSTDFHRQLTRDYFYTVNHHWLDVYHVDGFRYDCVPNYWDGPLGVGYASLVYETYQLTKGKLAQHETYWSRFDGGPGSRSDLSNAPSSSKVRRRCCRPPTRTAPGRTAPSTPPRQWRAAIAATLTDLGLSLGLFGYPDQVNVNQDDIPKAGLQYIENHDHERFICNFGIYNPDEAGNPLFAEGDRSRWFMLQPYLIGMLMSKGMPMLWQGAGIRRKLLPAGFWRGAGWPASSVALGFLLRRRRAAAGRVDAQAPAHPTRSRSHPTRQLLLLQRLGALPADGTCFCSRAMTGPDYTLVALNTGDQEQSVPFWFPIGGDYLEELHGGALDLHGYSIPPRGSPDHPIALWPGSGPRSANTNGPRLDRCPLPNPLPQSADQVRGGEGWVRVKPIDMSH